MIREKVHNAPSGLPVFFVLLLVLAGCVFAFIRSITAGNVPVAVLFGLAGLADFVCFFGMFMVNPNEARVLQLFGHYVGSVKEPGLRWANPFYAKRRVSQRVRNFESAHLKVNDLDGNPIEIAAVVVWKVIDTAEAIFEVDNFENYVHVQTEAALRNMATSYPYDTHEEGKMSLRGSTSEIAEHLKTEIQARLSKAGVEVIESRISHLAYASEIASAMLQRQQAGAIIAARARIVEGAVTMVQMALERLAAEKIVELDEEKKATMVSNLLVVLCGHGSAQPVINTGTLYQ
jgi:regulator of protease activity HflC (stomatin/prohibitin superfamily)